MTDEHVEAGISILNDNNDDNDNDDDGDVDGADVDDDDDDGVDDDDDDDDDDDEDDDGDDDNDNDAYTGCRLSLVPLLQSLLLTPTIVDSCNFTNHGLRGDLNVTTWDSKNEDSFDDLVDDPLLILVVYWDARKVMRQYHQTEIGIKILNNKVSLSVSSFSCNAHNPHNDPYQFKTFTIRNHPNTPITRITSFSLITPGPLSAFAVDPRFGDLRRQRHPRAPYRAQLGVLRRRGGAQGRDRGGVSQQLLFR